MEYSEVIEQLESMASSQKADGMARYGIVDKQVYGISIPDLRFLAKGIGRNHGLAEHLWCNGSREARILASMIDDPELVSEDQMESWGGEFDYWEVCDQVCANLFQKTPLVWQKALEWSQRQDASYKRAGFVLMARLAVADKKAPDENFGPFLIIIKDQAGDERNLVKKAINWALRQIGKRNAELNLEAIRVAREIKEMDSRSAKWIASDALRELQSEAVQRRLGK